MNAIKKYTTFDKLKSSKNNTVKDASALKKHTDFEKFIMAIKAVKIIQDNQTNDSFGK